MEKELEFLHQLTPEIDEMIHLRYKILSNISYFQPIGRRNLANRLKIKERKLRNELEILNDRHFVQVSANGMYLTQRGEDMVNKGRDIIRTLTGLSELERELKILLKLQEVIIVPGDSYEDEVIKQELGSAASKLFRRLIDSNFTKEKCNAKEKDSKVIAVTGGSTLAAMAEMLPSNLNKENLTVVPARGGLGEKVEHQANTVASQIAKKLNCAYRMLHVPDQLSQESVKSLLCEPTIKEIITLIKQSHILFHGIGRAEVMAKRRGINEEERGFLEREGATGEAFGFYLNREGQVIEKVNTVGLTLDDLDEIPTVVAIAGGRDKAEAILAMIETEHDDILVTDEGAARKIIESIKI
ncbi:sugar-binding transcriptional regulator [Natranaerofaba carboxydovora]|uniref:sugar-binding transcriptional regulator n=1 Tax=Natranaerofaba carboxydovora TaxID=2742683 RepID=UPI001F145987|nr:sugar-binding domain-containing protein [Natranaerofaba carboxydovora]UMZ72655.1 Central glycolytic regulator [Natranaerofaba carboxydovora]